jgi:predicted MFS family arabinose efflux permease
VAANALMQLAMMGVRIVGPAAAGVLVSAFGPNICYALDSVSFVASAALITSVAIVRPPQPPPSPDRPTNSIHAVLHDMSVGAKFIVHHAALSFVVLAMAAGLFTIGCFGPLIAIFVRDSLHASARAFGIVSGMVGVGLLVGTQLVRTLARHADNDTLVLSGLGGIGGGVLLLGAVPHLAATLAATFVIGFAFAAIMVPAQTLIQRETPPDMLGRVGSTNASIVFLGQILGLVLSGILAEAIGVRLVFFLCAVLALALVGAGRLFLRARN